MTELKRALSDALKDAMRAKDRERRDALRLLQSAVKQVEIDDRAELDEAGVMDILRREAKKRRETIAELEKAGRADDAERESFELAVVEEFLPRPLSPDELKAIIGSAIAETGATSMKDMGRVMRAALAKAGGRADGKAVSAIVRDILG